MPLIIYERIFFFYLFAKINIFKMSRTQKHVYKIVTIIKNVFRKT